MAWSVQCFWSRVTFLGLLALLEGVGPGVRGFEGFGMPYHDKISDSLYNQVERDETRKWNGAVFEIMVELRGLSGEEDDEEKSLFNANQDIRSLLGKLTEKVQNPKETRSPGMTQLVHELQLKMTENLTPVVELLTKLNVPFENLWATGEVYVREATWDVIEKIAAIDQVLFVRAPGILKKTAVPCPEIKYQHCESEVRKNDTWNLKLIDARCSDIGCLGNNVTIGFIDGGALVTHKEIQPNWIGMPYGLYDGAHPTVNCNPRDYDDHGTHVVGITCGVNIGVASNAKWMMCVGCTDNNCTEPALKICGQYLLCPWKCGDTTPDKVTKNCSARPDVINNSWGLTNKELLDTPYDFYYSLLQMWNAVGIISVFAAGNEGPDCTSGIPPSTYDIALSVGAVDRNVTLPYFSSVGPQLSRRALNKNTTATGTCKMNTCAKNPKTTTVCSLIKPDIVGPGVNVCSAFNSSNTAYVLMNGTSMAAPHVAGVIALMKCAKPQLNWNYKLAYQLLTNNTHTSSIHLLTAPTARYGRRSLDTNLMCNFVLSKICKTFPNNMFGFGLLDACKAVKATKNYGVGGGGPGGHHATREELGEEEEPHRVDLREDVGAGYLINHLNV